MYTTCTRRAKQRILFRCCLFTAVSALSLLYDHLIEKLVGPGSFIEVRKVLPLLTAVEEGHPSFDVVALGLPGYGFSEGAKKKGFDLKKYGEVGHKLMLSLGYNEYGTPISSGLLYGGC